jgi:glycosyltransferase involved in cell wall biosynthesis
MKIAILDSDGRNYTIESADREPLGGTQSAICNLSRCLVALGHEITIFCGTRDGGTVQGVRHLASSNCTLNLLKSLNQDIYILVSSSELGERIASILTPRQRLILWTHIMDDQPPMRPLAEVKIRDAFDGYAFVTQWQAEQYRDFLGLDLRKAIVLRNAVSPAFAALFPHGEPILPRKSLPPIVAYTSSPLRGLNILLDAFPEIRAGVPGARLWVFSSLRLYAKSLEEDLRDGGTMYEQCRRLEGAEYIGALPQPQLAERMREVSIWAYPNTHAETSCIAAMEAMAAGCRTVTTAGAALPETTAGFGRLIPAGLTLAEYRGRFIDEVVAALKQSESDPAGLEEMLRNQRKFVRQNYHWPSIARQWEEWLTSLPLRR